MSAAKMLENTYGDEDVIVLLAGAAVQKKHAPSSLRGFSATGDHELAESQVLQRKGRSG
jgi:hypothetical protein